MAGNAVAQGQLVQQIQSTALYSTGFSIYMHAAGRVASTSPAAFECQLLLIMPVGGHCRLADIASTGWLIFTGVPADARYLLRVSYPSSERQHVLTL